MKSTTQNQTEPAIVTGLTTNGAPAPTGGAATTDKTTLPPKAEVGEIKIENDPITSGMIVKFTDDEEQSFLASKQLVENVINNLIISGVLKGDAGSLAILKRIAINLIAILIKGEKVDALRREAAMLYLSAKMILEHGTKIEFFERLKLAFDGRLDLVLRELNREIEAIRRWLAVKVWEGSNKRSATNDDIGLIKPVSIKEIKLDPDFFAGRLATDEFKKEFENQDFQKRYGYRPPASTVQKRIIKAVEQLNKVTAELDSASLEALKTKTNLLPLINQISHEVVTNKDVLDALVVIPTVEPPVAAPPAKKPEEKSRG